MRSIIRGATLLVAAVVLALVGPAAIAQAATPHHQAQGAPSGCGTNVSHQDARFLKAAHQSNLAEIQTGQLAVSRSKTAAVRDLGMMFVTDHTPLDADLVKVAAKLGVTLPSRPNAEQRAFAAKLDKLSGAEFDKAWLKGQIKGHRKAKATGQHELKTGSDCDAITVARTSAPIVVHHLDELVSLRSTYRS